MLDKGQARVHHPAGMSRVFLTALSAFVVLLAGAAVAQAQPVVRHNPESPAEVRRYWTPERMRQAIPMDRTARAGGPREKARPSKGGGSSSSSSLEVTKISGALTAHGKVFFTDRGANYVCSGTAVEGDVVWTAGHCVNEGPGAFYTNFLFVPAYRDGQAPYGEFAAPDLMTTSSWASAGEFGVDVGAAIPGKNGSDQTLSGAVVERSIIFESLRRQAYSLYGYPAAKRYNGQRMRVCNTAWARDDAGADPPTMGVACDMTGGSSGGGWVTSTGEVASVVSYGYSSLKNVLFGPYLESGGEAQDLYTRATAASASQQPQP